MVQSGSQGCGVGVGYKSFGLESPDRRQHATATFALNTPPSLSSDEAGGASEMGSNL
jgi:hypothetical protein